MHKVFPGHSLFLLHIITEGGYRKMKVAAAAVVDVDVMLLLKLKLNLQSSQLQLQLLLMLMLQAGRRGEEKRQKSISVRSNAWECGER